MLNDGSVMEIESPAKLPDLSRVDHIEEPFILGTILVPSEYVGAVMKLTQEKRGIQRSMEYLDTKTVQLVYELPFSEILFDFYDKLKSITRGYASFDYEHLAFRPSDVVKLDILLNEQPVDAFSTMIHKVRPTITAGRSPAGCGNSSPARCSRSSFRRPWGTA